MRRMMTCRSRLAFAVLGLALFVGRAEAQDTLQVVQPSGQGRTHVVQTGETLWALAERYLGDPLLWPAIYRLNTMVVEDPHWIYPGEELQLGAPGDVAIGIADPADTTVAQPLPSDTLTGQSVSGQRGATPGDTTLGVDRPTVGGDLPPPPPPPGEGGSTVFTKQPSRAIAFSGRAGTSGARSVLPGQFYGAGFLTENDRLPWAEVIGAAGKATVGSLTTVSSAHIYESIEIRAPSGSSYHIGDSLLVAIVGREVPKWGQIVKPTGIARVREVSDRRVVADILSQWSRIGSSQAAMPLEPFRNTGTAGPVPIENGLTGRVIVGRDLAQLQGQQSIIFIDKGRDDGVSLGDIFEVLRPNPPGSSPEAPLKQIAVLQIVHVRQRSASGVVTQIGDVGMGPGSPVRLIRKMSS